MANIRTISMVVLVEVVVVMVLVGAVAAAVGTPEEVHTLGHLAGVEVVPLILVQTKITKPESMKVTVRLSLPTSAINFI
jgi:hypothetical protein